MFKYTTRVSFVGAFVTLLSPLSLAQVAYSDTVYGPFPVTEKSYNGNKTNSVSYTGQIARHVLHDSLKKLAGKGNGGGNAVSLEAEMMAG